jgi:hypothetical protein
MAMSRTPLAGILLVGGIAVAAGVFGSFNWGWLEQRHVLEREGVAAVARIDAVSISHKTCNSSAQLTWTEARGAVHAGRFMTCFANRWAGQTIPIRYLKTDPDTAMIAPGEGGLPDDQFHTGAMIGAVVAMVLGCAAAKLMIDRRRSNAG